MGSPHPSVTAIFAARQQETVLLVGLANQAEGVVEAARWYLEEGSPEARERLAGAVAAWEAAT